MTWSIHHVALRADDLATATRFFAELIGLGPASPAGEDACRFGSDGRGLHLIRPRRGLQRSGADLLAPVGTRHVAITVADLDGVVARLDRAAVSHVVNEGTPNTVWALDPALNLVAFNDAPASAGDGIHAWERAWGWGLHHVNLPAHDVRETIGFYVEIAGMEEGRWQAPSAMGDFSIDPAQLVILPLGEGNRGLHLIRPDDGFGWRNGFAHNPSIGGHPAFWVADLSGVMARLAAAGVLFSDAGVYAMPGMHQLYVHDPHANVLEINQYV